MRPVRSLDARRGGCESRRVADLYTLAHEDAGPVSTFPTREEAETELAAALRDEPDWLPDLRVVPFELIVSK